LLLAGEPRPIVSLTCQSSLLVRSGEAAPSPQASNENRAPIGRDVIVVDSASIAPGGGARVLRAAQDFIQQLPSATWLSWGHFPYESSASKHLGRPLAGRWRRSTISAPANELSLISSCVPDVADLTFLVSSTSASFAHQPDVPYPAKRFVYIIRVDHPERCYVGISADVSARLDAHNAAQNRSTAPWRPWRVDVVIEFRREPLAGRFEKYLK
jgi:putative endonuclease